MSPVITSIRPTIPACGSTIWAPRNKHHRLAAGAPAPAAIAGKDGSSFLNGGGMIFVAKRLVWALVVLFVVATLTFLLSHVVPADPAAFLAGQNASAESVARIAAKYGLNRPLGTQFLDYIGGLLQGDLGYSMRTKESVALDLIHFLPATLELLFVSFVTYLVFSFGLAIAAVRKPGGIIDQSIQLGTMLSSGIPVFWLGMALQF